MRFNRASLASLATNPATKFDKEGLLIITERQDGWWRTDVKLECWCKLRGNLLFYLVDKDPRSIVAGVLVLQNCQPRIQNEEPELDGYVFDLDFKDSPSHRIVTHSASDRLDWVRSIEACSNDLINAQIKHLKQQIAAASAIQNTNRSSMGNRIDQGLPLSMSLSHESCSVSSAELVTADMAAATPFEGDLIQF